MPARLNLWRVAFIAIMLALFSALAIPIFKSYRHSVNRQATKDHLKQISLALNSYHEQYKTFPPAFVSGPDGRMWHSWRTLLLPYLDEQELAARYRMDEPWDSPHNHELVAECPEVFQSPFWGTEPGRTNFYAVIGRRTAWPAQHAISIDRALDGLSNTIHVVEAAPVACWSEPLDLGVSEWIDAFRQHDRDGGSHVVLMDGAVRFISTKISQIVLVSLLTPRYGQMMYSGPDWPTELTDKIDTNSSWETRDVHEFQATDVVAAALEPLDSQKNEVWCATFQIAWDELSKKLQEKVKTSPSPPRVELLNAEVFNRQSLAPETYLALATGSGPADTQSLIEQVQQKFPQLVPQVESFPDDGNPDLRLYACLVKSLPFVEQMDRFPKPLCFKHGEGAIDVVSFGRMPEAQVGLGEVVLHDQVIVGDYISDEDFVLVLKTMSPQKDEIILAHVAPGESLRSLWKDVEKRLQSPHPHRIHADLHDAERLEIPVLEFGLSKRFEDLDGVSINNAPMENHTIVARESILFRLDERGAEIIAEAESMSLGENGFPEVPFDPTRPRNFVFNRPFFIALREKDATEPYFLGWIAHPEVMERYIQSNR